MQLSDSVCFRIRYALDHIADLRTGRLRADPRWLACIEDTYQSLSAAKRAFFRDLFIRHLPNEDLMYNHFIEHTTLYNWRQEIFASVALRAAATGLIHPFE